MKQVVKEYVCKTLYYQTPFHMPRLCPIAPYVISLVSSPGSCQSFMTPVRSSQLHVEILHWLQLEVRRGGLAGQRLVYLFYLLGFLIRFLLMNGVHSLKQKQKCKSL